jgi:hypothetical protein
MEAKMARDWNTEWQQIADEQNEAWSDHILAMTGLTVAFAGNGTPTEDLLDKLDEADQRVEDARAIRKEFINDYRASQP